MDLNIKIEEKPENFIKTILKWLKFDKKPGVWWRI